MISPAAMRVLGQRHGLELLEWRHFEISRLRWLARYGIGAAETVFGSLLRMFNKAAWDRARVEKTTRYIGIAYYRFSTTR